MCLRYDFKLQSVFFQSTLSLLSIFINYNIIIFSRFTFHVIHCHFCSVLFYLNNKRYSIIRYHQLLIETRNCSLSLNYICHQKKQYIFSYEKRRFIVFILLVCYHITLSGQKRTSKPVNWRSKLQKLQNSENLSNVRKRRIVVAILEALCNAPLLV